MKTETDSPTPHPSWPRNLSTMFQRSAPLALPTMGSSGARRPVSTFLCTVLSALSTDVPAASLL